MALAVDFFCFFSWRPSVKVQGRVILCSNDHFRKWASKCEVLSSPEMALIDRLAGFHFQVTFNCDYSCPLLIWVVCAEVFFALIWNGTVYILKLFRPASKGSDHFEYFVVIWQTDKQTKRYCGSSEISHDIWNHEILVPDWSELYPSGLPKRKTTY